MERSKKVEKLTKEEKAELRVRMQHMVDEANALRDEASKKMRDIPKGYRLNTPWVEWRFFLEMSFYVGLCAVFLLVFFWSTNGDDTIHTIMAVICTVAVVAGLMHASAMKNRPYHIEEHMKDFYINNFWYDELDGELNRLKTGIADYDRQYEEQKEYIQKFRDQQIEVEDFGSLSIVLIANDFHANVRMVSEMDEVDCRLKFNEPDYQQLIGFIEFFNRRCA